VSGPPTYRYQINRPVGVMEFTRRGDAIYCVITALDGTATAFTVTIPGESVTDVTAGRSRLFRAEETLDKIRELVCPDVERWPNG
jgi:hypothetical protein